MTLISATDDLFAAALDRMRPPHKMHIICIDITNKCDLACSNCTRLLENQDAFWDMSLENFREAVRSLSDFPGTIAVIGGNPAMHRDFEGICKILVEEIPQKERRGLWTNNVFKHAELVKEVFGGFNLNPHGDARGIKSLEPIRELKIGNYYEGHSMHSPLLTAVKDIFPENEMWDRISNCDINQEWSASIVQNKGQLRAYFCEVAAAFDLARGTDNGIPVTPGWWRKGIRDFSNQVKHFCPGCGVPARLKGHKDCEETDTYTKTNSDLAEKSRDKKRRKIVELDPTTLDFEHVKVTQYSEESRKKRMKKASLRKRIVKKIQAWLP
jgi:organic radical activating enzyme